MNPECKDIVKVILPAVRASIAEVAYKKYGYKQEEIAAKMGVVQVAVSKYLHGRHSRDISRIKNYIIEHKLNEEAIGKMVRGASRQEMDDAIDKLCESLVAKNIA